jgi:hypothetical protein
MTVALLGVHTPLKNPRPVSRIQAYIAELFNRLIFEGSVLLWSESDLRNGCRNVWETVVL